MRLSKLVYGSILTTADSGAFDTVPEVVILLSFLAGDKSSDFVDILFDEAGHRVATQYLLKRWDGRTVWNPG